MPGTYPCPGYACNETVDACDYTCVLAETPQPEPQGVRKNRYISFVPGSPGVQAALRVTLVDMPPGMDQFEECRLWIGEPSTVSELAGEDGSTRGSSFWAAAARDTPYYTDWGDFDLLHVYGDAFVPGALYGVEAILETCDTGMEGAYSVPLAVETSRWGDIVGDCAQTPCSGPDGEVNFDDLASLVDKFTNAPGAPIKARADIAPIVADRIIDFVDISSAVGAFRGLPYPYDGPGGCP
jgi:hypothetical protein